VSKSDEESQLGMVVIIVTTWGLRSNYNVGKKPHGPIKASVCL